MSIDRASPQAAPLWRGRWLEWSLVAAVILGLTWAYAYQLGRVRAQGELAAVKSTLGALRMALVIDYVRQKAGSNGLSVATTQRNPFELLQRRPANYLGEMSRAKAASAPAGSWVFAADCACVGYVPLHAQWFQSPSGDALAWFAVRGAPGPFEIVAQESYVLQNQLLD